MFAIPFPTNYANNNQLRQTESVLVVFTQLGSARTPLLSSLNYSVYLINNIIIIIIIINITIIINILLLHLLQLEL